jgi:hypothetical protein
MPTHDLNNTRIDAMNLHKVIIKNWISHSTPKTNIFNIVLCNISLDSSTHHWDQAKLNHMMGFTNPSHCGKSLHLYCFYLILDTLLFTIECYTIMLMTNVQEMGELMTLLRDLCSSWQLLHIISASIPNIHTKTAGGVQHNSTPPLCIHVCTS